MKPSPYSDSHLDRSFKRIGSFAWYSCRVIDETETTVKLEWRYPFQAKHTPNHLEWYARDKIELV
jgi:hypothetical protein